MDCIKNPEIPYFGSIFPNFGPGKWIKIHGVVPSAAFKFQIVFQCGTDIVMNGNIALQIVFNFLDNHIQINSMRNGIWDEAQTITGIPLWPQTKFVIGLSCDYTQYELFINEQHFCELPQRISYDRITHLSISGDVHVTLIHQANDVRASATAPLEQAFRRTETQQYGFRATETPPPSYNEVVSKSPVQSPHSYGSFPVVPPAAGEVPPYTANALFMPLVPVQSGATIPLNAASSNFRPVTPLKRKRYVKLFCCFIFIVIIIGVGIYNNKRKNNHYHEHSRNNGYDYK